MTLMTNPKDSTADHQQEDPSAGVEDDLDNDQRIPRPDHQHEDPSAGVEDDLDDDVNGTTVRQSTGGPLCWSGGWPGRRRKGYQDWTINMRTPLLQWRMTWTTTLKIPLRPNHQQEDPSAGAEDDLDDDAKYTAAGPSRRGGPLCWSGG
ncbi:uncharacterized protein LOC101854300 [Aplysia californica]|uniref:Uncharacterized protein LOC101854300 n=1 Tax=Aplysia californica TaxID=6500 RepID=A0ABM1W3B0_APLCA|nr:uncharacterized protein LOC101854300 [Aplysia californica]XP_035829153.1 uncharacterized protein LOC101854300 [Aplysia californica]XP_035829154.1 uncharacterized protein LOC101854300 [Aplysia californica]